MATAGASSRGLLPSGLLDRAHRGEDGAVEGAGAVPGHLLQLGAAGVALKHGGGLWSYPLAWLS